MTDAKQFHITPESFDCLRKAHRTWLAKVINKQWITFLLLSAISFAAGVSIGRFSVQHSTQQPKIHALADIQSPPSTVVGMIADVPIGMKIGGLIVGLGCCCWVGVLIVVVAVVTTIVYMNRKSSSGPSSP